jgi:hypothetical protein
MFKAVNSSGGERRECFVNLVREILNKKELSMR